MEIQQHNDVVVDVAGSRQGFAELLREGEVLQGEREAPGALVLLPSLPPLYIGTPGGRRPWEIRSPRGAAAKGGFPPSQVGGAPTPRVSQP